MYIYSHDSDSAYTPADRMVLARVPKDRIREREAYEFFKGLDADGRPVWTRQYPAIAAPCSSIPADATAPASRYNAGLKRYLWCQILPFSTDERGPRFQGGFGIYEAPRALGPLAHGLLHGDLGHRPRRNQHLPGEMDERGRPNPPSPLLRQRLLSASAKAIPAAEA